MLLHLQDLLSDQVRIAEGLELAWDGHVLQQLDTSPKHVLMVSLVQVGGPKRGILARLNVNLRQKRVQQVDLLLLVRVVSLAKYDFVIVNSLDVDLIFTTALLVLVHVLSGPQAKLGHQIEVLLMRVVLGEHPIHRLDLEGAVLVNDLRLFLLLVHAVVAEGATLLLDGFHLIWVLHVLHIEVSVESGRRTRARRVKVVARCILEEGVIRFSLFVCRAVIAAQKDLSLYSILGSLAGIRLRGFERQLQLEGLRLYHLIKLRRNYNLLPGG